MTVIVGVDSSEAEVRATVDHELRDEAGQAKVRTKRPAAIRDLQVGRLTHFQPPMDWLRARIVAYFGVGWPMPHGGAVHDMEPYLHHAPWPGHADGAPLSPSCRSRHRSKAADLGEDGQFGRAVRASAAENLGTLLTGVELTRVVVQRSADSRQAPAALPAPPGGRPSLAGQGAGFTTAEPWLPVVTGAESLCVESQQQDPGSSLAFVRKLIHLRSREPTLQSGTLRLFDAAADVFCYERELDRRFLIALNFGSHRVPLALATMPPALLSWRCPLIPDESVAPSTCRISCSIPTKA